jgi:hypothetical protein
MASADDVVILNDNDIIINLESLIKTVTRDDGLNAGNIMMLVSTLMETVGKYKKLSGPDKKRIVILVLKHAIDTSNEDSNTKEILNLAMENIVPPAIDIMVDIANGKYEFKSLKKISIFCRLKCCI